MRNIMKSSRLRLILPYMIILCLVLAISHASVYFMFKNIISEQLGLSAQSTAVALASRVMDDIDGYTRFIETRDVDSPYYRNMQEYFQQIKASGAPIRFIYTERPISDDTVEFLLDAEPVGSDNYSPPGSTTFMDTASRQVYTTGLPARLSPTVHPEFGTLFGGCAPIFDANGKGLGLVGVNVDMTEMLNYINMLQFILLAVSAVIMGVCFVLLGKYAKNAEATAMASEEAQRANGAKSEFLASMSHEMRTPMNAIIGMSAIAQSADADMEKKDYCLTKIMGASRHLLGVINDILDMSKIEANKLELFPAEFSFEMMLKKVVDIIMFRVDEKKLQFTVYIGPALPRCLIGDEQRLVQVIVNLLSNAVKFTPDEGKVHLDARLESTDANGICTLRVTVQDSGIGIAKEHQSRLFSSFEQADGGVSRRFGGTGLGLAISKRIVEMMEGSIWVESKFGEGALFGFTVRLRQGLTDGESLLRQGADWPNLTMLAVDDDPATREYFLELAKQIGVSCQVSESGAEACARLACGERYDMYFVDWKMPGMNGIELARKIKEYDTRQSVVVMMSSAEWNALEKDAKSAGVMKFLPKPLFASSIANCVNECLGVSASMLLDAEEAGIPDFSGYRLLLVEDIAINQEVVQALLEPAGLAIDCAFNGLEALRMFSEAPELYDIIFMDVHMPEMDGYEATRRIRALPLPRAASIPIVAMTANVFREDVERCLASGMNAHLGKPLDFQDVIELLRNYLQPA